jgi:hypothetical protein
MKFNRLVLGLILSIGLLPGCGDDGMSSDAPPKGACRTGGSATGSYSSACNQCGKQHCNAELSDKAGSGWAQQYWGGNGSCAAFNGCTCNCLSSGSDPLHCVTTVCIASMDAACQAAVQKAQDCLDTNCAAECR